MPDLLLPLAFLGAAALSLGASVLLVTRLERVGARLSFSEAGLGLVAALAADCPEITSAASALVRHQHDIGVGVVFGSNAFNLASMLGLGAIVAGRIQLHRRVVILAGSVAIATAFIGTAVVHGVPPVIGLAAAALVLVPYVIVSATPARFRGWLRVAVLEEEQELQSMIRPVPGRLADAVTAASALIVVVGASAAMEYSGSVLGARYAISDALVGGVLLAVVTSLPNAVAAVYLASRARGSAVLSTTLNSNTINVTVGLLLMGSLIGLGQSTAASLSGSLWNIGLTAGAIVLAYIGRGLGRIAGLWLIAGYALYLIALLR